MPRKPNFMIVITDQQSGNPYWPEAWEENNLPAMRWLKNHGINFKRAYTNSCSCSPARVTMLTGLYPAQHGVTEVLEFDNISRVYEDITFPGEGENQGDGHPGDAGNRPRARASAPEAHPHHGDPRHPAARHRLAGALGGSEVGRVL
jgi:predicted AlkP superfamily pyrophosphatase or phosphodiesterase